MIHFFVFSGTGNTLYLAKRLSSLLNETSIIKLLNDNNKKVTISADKIIICFPVYAYTQPKIIRQFIKESKLITNHVIAIVTYGTAIGKSIQTFNKLLKKYQNRELSYSNKVLFPENINSLFKNNEEKNKLKYLKADISISSIANDLNNNLHPPYKKVIFPFGLISLIYKIGESSFVLKKTRLKGCNKCGLCAKLCPSNAIIMNDKPKFVFKKCNQCQRCIAYCPKKAIGMFCQNNKSERYKNPFIEISEYF